MRLRTLLFPIHNLQPDCNQIAPEPKDPAQMKWIATYLVTKAVGFSNLLDFNSLRSKCITYFAFSTIAKGKFHYLKAPRRGPELRT
jgi:hypothetical protein